MKEILPPPPLQKKFLHGALLQKKVHLFSTSPSLSYLLSMKVHMAWTTGRNIFQALVRDKYSWDDLRTTWS